MVSAKFALSHFTLSALVEINIMKQTINFWQFRDMFIAMDRQSNFPGNGLSVLWDYLEGFEQSTGEEIELDVVALCCEFSQDHWRDIADNYRIDLEGLDDDEERKEAVIDYLQNNTCFIVT